MTTFTAGQAFKNRDVWNESFEYIKKSGGYYQNFVKKAVEQQGFNLFESYGKNFPTYSIRDEIFSEIQK